MRLRLKFLRGLLLGGTLLLAIPVAAEDAGCQAAPSCSAEPSCSASYTPRCDGSCQGQCTGHHHCCIRPLQWLCAHKHRCCAAPPEGTAAGYMPYATAMPMTYAAPMFAAPMAAPVSFVPQTYVPAMPMSMPAYYAPMSMPAQAPRASSPLSDINPETLRALADALQAPRTASAPSSCTSNSARAPLGGRAPLSAPQPPSDRTLEERVEALENNVTKIQDVLFNIEKRVQKLEGK